MNVGVVGLGTMGTSFASNLLSRGYHVHVYNRTAKKADSLVSRGAVFHQTPAELATAVDVLLTSLTDHNAVDALAIGENGFLGSLKKGSLWVDLSTISPDASIRHAKLAEERGLERLDAPVVGSRDLAVKGELVILVGGTRSVFEKHESFLSNLGKTLVYLGTDGSGHKMKLVVNLYLGLIAASYSEALALSGKLGFEENTFVSTINKTPHKNYFSEGKGPKIAEGNFEAAFSLNNLLKDLRLAQDQIKKTGAVLPLSTMAVEEYAQAASDGYGSMDFSIIAREILRKNTAVAEKTPFVV